MTAPRQARVWLGSFSKHSTEIEFSTFAELRYGLDTFCTYRNIQGSTAVFRGTQKMLLPNTLPPNTDPVDIYIDTTPLGEHSSARQFQVNLLHRQA
jgi:hypothetical protein